jgi:hypothetical protein
MLENFLRPKLDGVFDEHGVENVWFEQDGATAHTSRPLRVFLWGYLKV